MIPLFKVRMSPNAPQEVENVLMSGYIGQGERVEQFEDQLQKEWNSKIRPVTVNSGTSALDLALELIGVGPGDEVISTPQTCFATQVGIIHRHAKIVWADIDPKTGLLNIQSVASKITGRTKAIMGVNWAGRTCDYNALKKFGIPVIEDAAHNWGYDINNHGTYIAFSFQAIKFLTTGDGGALIPPADKEYEARLLRWYGLDRNKGESFRCAQNIRRAGFKYHMNDIAAVIGLSNIPEAISSNISHMSNAAYYSSELNEIPWLFVPKHSWGHSHWLYTVIMLDGDRDDFSTYLNKYGIANSPVHYRNDMYDATVPFRLGKLPGVDEFSKKQLSIPVGWWVSKDEQDYIIKTIKNYK